jgi:hypothetical protein
MQAELDHPRFTTPLQAGKARPFAIDQTQLLRVRRNPLHIRSS